MPSTPQSLLWDVFCTVVDNYGDAGVCWRLAVNLAQRGQRVRLWIDDTNALPWLSQQKHANITLLHWQRPINASDLPHEPADVLLEALGCTLDDAVLSNWAQQRQNGKAGLWLNWEYLSAEDFVERNHLLSSPVLYGPARGCSKVFFYPGFTANTGGLMREPDLLHRQQTFNRSAWLQKHHADPQRFTYSLFCYEPPALAQWLEQLAATTPNAGASSQILVTQGRAWQAMQTALAQAQQTACSIHALPWLSQNDFDHLLWASDCNFVRGEDSLVRALWAGKPFIWNIYPQHDNAHHAKLDAFLDWLDAPADMRRFHEVWNGIRHEKLPQPHWALWQECVTQARERLLQQHDMASQLLGLTHRLLTHKNHA